MASTNPELFPIKPELRVIVDADSVQTSAAERRQAAPVALIGLNDYVDVKLEDILARLDALEGATG